MPVISQTDCGSCFIGYKGGLGREELGRGDIQTCKLSIKQNEH